jgi:hypothetical protein
MASVGIFLLSATVFLCGSLDTAKAQPAGCTKISGLVTGGADLEITYQSTYYTDYSCVAWGTATCSAPTLYCYRYSGACPPATAVNCAAGSTYRSLSGLCVSN